MRDPAGLTIAELLADEETLPEHGTLGATLDAIVRTVRDDAVTVSVTLHGKLIGLELSEQGMQLSAAALADRISKVTAEAAAAALSDGLQALSDACGEHIASAVTDYIGPIVPAQVAVAEPDPEPPARAADDDGDDGDDDEFAPQSWAIAWDR